MRKMSVLMITQAAIIAALYVVLTWFSTAIGLSSGVIQVRFSEALSILPYFTPAAIPGLTVGCFLSNLITGCLWQDVIFGTVATLLGAWGAYWLRRVWWLVPLPTVLANTLIVPPILAYVYHAEGGIPFLMLTVGTGEVISAYVLGLILLLSLRRRASLFSAVPIKRKDE